MLTPVQINYNQNYYKQQPKFHGQMSVKSAVCAEKTLRSVEFTGRRIVDKIVALFTKKSTNALHEELSKVDTKSPNYIETISKLSRKFGAKQDIELNIESGRIEQIASSGKPHIFIMNHDNQSKDPQMLMFFNTLLNDEYIKTGQSATCPRPKIILNEDILLSKNKKQREIFLKMGAVPIDANIYAANKKTNVKQFVSLIRGFIKGESNIFIFPEGKNAIFKNAPLENKFQLGVGEIISKITDKIPEVNVTPIGFAYNKGKNKSAGDSIYIGKTIIFKKDGENTLVSAGNISSTFAQKDYKEFFGNDEMATITDKSIPVKGHDLPAYISGILCENLRICKEEAKAVLPKKSSGETVLEV